MNETLAIFANIDRKWFDYEDASLDPYLCAIILLEKLSTRPKRGLAYNRISLVKNLIDRNSKEGLKALDSSIVLLISRSLIEINTISDFNSKILITPKGKDVLKEFQRRLKSEN